MRQLLLMGLLLALSACGGGSKEDFAIGVKRPPKAVLASLGSIRLSDIAVTAFAGMTLQKVKSADDEIVYTIPMSSSPNSKDEPATFRFKLEPVSGGTTQVHVFVDVPPIRVLMGEPNMALSEAKVEIELKKALMTWVKDMARGPSYVASTEEISDLFANVAVAGNHKFQSQVNSAKAGFVHRGSLAEDDGDADYDRTALDEGQRDELGDAADRDDRDPASDASESEADADAERSDQSG